MAACAADALDAVCAEHAAAATDLARIDLPADVELPPIEADLQRLLQAAKRPASAAVLQSALERVRAESKARKVAAAIESASAMNVPVPRSEPPPPVKLATSIAPAEETFTKFASYAWDQSAKWVKIYLTVGGGSTPSAAQAGDASNAPQVNVHFGASSLTVEVRRAGAGARNQRLAMPALGGPIVADKCTWQLKDGGTLLVKMRKEADGIEWGSLDDSAARKAREHEARLEQNKDKSTAELLAEMYADADEEGKAGLAKAWEDGREAREGRKRVGGSV